MPAITIQELLNRETQRPATATLAIRAVFVGAGAVIACGAIVAWLLSCAVDPIAAPAESLARS